MTELLSYLWAIEWQWPLALILLPLPWLVRSCRAKVSDELTHSGLRMPALYEVLGGLGLVQDSAQQHPSRLRALVLAIAWGLIVLACARPHHVGNEISLPLSGRDLMLAIDISPSMKQRDMLINNVESTRLMAVKSVVGDFIARREGDRIGLILFGSQPYVQAPLTFDLKTVETLLNEAFLGMAGQSTAIGDAITLATKRLRQRPEQSRVLILLTDGQNTAGEIPPEKAAQFAAQANIRIYTIGIGAEEILQRSFFGVQRVNPSADLDEAMLKLIASTTGGSYYRARDLEELNAIYETIEALEPIEQEPRTYRPQQSLGHYLVLAAITAWLVLMLLGRMLGRMPGKMRGGKLRKMQEGQPSTAQGFGRKRER